MSDTKNVPLRAGDITLVLAALRATQLLFTDSPDIRSICEWKLLDEDEIEALCEKINIRPESGFDLDATERGTLYFALMMWGQWSEGHRFKQQVAPILEDGSESDTSKQAAIELRFRLKDTITPAERADLVA
ncbi:hypothetical protein TK90_2613 (plasmid) [Thioalkalivibrio sp. K90mix]|uniref:hypothetical protein n=1 Tax=Thioalkalivibrio sp. (strain K90mix) TaxID=396595 RepID=UPI000195AB1F|nr:hypothetical protein [Thioalkalivibrio sp. K90mix]ADC73100.1 hypothetical protein TK90_2613 [Thioalkalivibrio sp. K90mix]